MSFESSQPMYCYAHPNRETLLRCNQCNRPMCTACAVHTPTGYRCKECVKGQQRIFDTAQWWDYPIAVVIGGILGWLGSLVSSYVGFFTIFLAPFAGMIIAEAIRRAVNKRRSRGLPIIAAAAALIGSLIRPLIMLFFTILSGGGLAEGLFSSLAILIWPGVYTVLVVSTVFYRLKGIRV